jgi:hypothetical protein
MAPRPRLRGRQTTEPLKPIGPIHRVDESDPSTDRRCRERPPGAGARCARSPLGRRNIAPPPPKPRGGPRALAGRGASRSGSLSVTTTHAPFALKAQRKVSNGVAGLAAAGSSLDRQKIAANLPSQRLSNIRFAAIPIKVRTSTCCRRLVISVAGKCRAASVAASSRSAASVQPCAACQPRCRSAADDCASACV